MLLLVTTTFNFKTLDVSNKTAEPAEDTRSNAYSGKVAHRLL